MTVFVCQAELNLVVLMGRWTRNVSYAVVTVQVKLFARKVGGKSGCWWTKQELSDQEGPDLLLGQGVAEAATEASGGQ